jgi:hypothetical protein
MLIRDDAPGLRSITCRCHRDIREEIGAAWMTHEIWKLLKSSVMKELAEKGEKPI